MYLLILLILAGSQESVSFRELRVGINVESGESLTEVTQKLYSAGVIRHPFWFKVWARVTHKDCKIKAGYYIFEKPTSIGNALRTLVEGKTADIKVTIPEGATLREIAWLFWKKGGVDKEKFIKLASDTSYIRMLGLATKSLEGYLFPATYFIHYNISPREVISLMINRFYQVFGPKFKQRTTKIGFTLEECVIFASLIEKEAMCDSEKPVISSVYHNRLEHNYALQCDATIQYILPYRKRRLTYKDVRIPSLYNTYLHPGLPPGAICSPGESSIRAALWPSETDYFYFVAKGDRTHIFSKTLKEHQLAKRKVRNKVVSNQ